MAECWGALLSLAGAAAAWTVARGATPATELTVDIRYSHFEPSQLSVPVGEPVTIVLRNEDPIDHEWIVGDAAVHARHRTGTEPHHGARPTEVSIPALTTLETTVTFPQPGIFAYICHLPGHEAYGMTGLVTVT